jgi:hypothetical protein
VTEVEPPPETAPADAPAPAEAPSRRHRGLSLPRWAAFGLVLVLLAGVGFVAGRLAAPSDAEQATFRPGPSVPPTTLPSDPDRAALARFALAQSDLTGGLGLQLIPGGNQVRDQPSLDLCNGTFPSESLRTARLQVAAVDEQGGAPLSTEAVLYRNPAATEQAFRELKATVSQCPDAPVQSPVGEPTVTTTFNAAPDASWPQVRTVDRLAYDFVTTDSAGMRNHSVAVYLRRGRALLGLYFTDPDSPLPTIAGQTTIAGVVNTFEQRMAQLPDSVVNG